MAIIERTTKIEEKINQLMARKDKIAGKRQNQLSKILNRCGASKISDEILAGAVIEAVRAYQKGDSRISAWETEGKSILNPGRGKKKFI